MLRHGSQISGLSKWPGEPGRRAFHDRSRRGRRVRVTPPEDRPLVALAIAASAETVPTGTVVPCPGA